MKHHCRERDRLDELRSPVGQAAFSYYNVWFKARRFSPQSIETFAEAKLYSAFVKFARHVVATNMPDPEEFVRLMVKTDVPPVLWTRDTTYSLWLQTYDAAVPPEKQLVRAIDELTDLAKDLNCALPDVFKAIGVKDLLHLISKRRLTYWSLLASDRFKAYLLSLPSEEKDLLANAINVPAALGRFRDEPYLLREFSAALREVGL
jgi:hypothetical protein